MTPVNQTVYGFPHGNCYQACVASLLDLPIDDVPYYEGGDVFAYSRWLKDTYGLIVRSVGCKGEAGLEAPWFSDLGYVIATVPSQTVEGKMHAVIMRNGVIVHDPREQDITKYRPPISVDVLIKVMN